MTSPSARRLFSFRKGMPKTWKGECLTLYSGEKKREGNRKLKFFLSGVYVPAPVD